MSVSDRYRRFSEGVPKWVGWDGFVNFIAIKLTDITAQPLSGWDGLDRMGRMWAPPFWNRSLVLIITQF